MIKLLCFPYAGGSATIYSRWKKHLHGFIELQPIEFSGRGRRFHEPLFKNFDEAVNDLFEIVSDTIKDSKFAIFGHSMGSLFAFELYHKIMETSNRCPEHIFFSGANPPNVKNNILQSHGLSDKEFMEEIYKLRGTPREVIDNKSIYDTFAPIIIADYKILDSYNYIEKKQKICCDISLLVGKSDTVVNSNNDRWTEFTSKRCSRYEFNGDHFFIHEQSNEIIEIINHTLNNAGSINNELE